jgi:hypothetical protein
MYKSTFRSDQRRSKLTKRFIVDPATTRKAASKRVMKLTRKLDEAARRPGGPCGAIRPAAREAVEDRSLKLGHCQKSWAESHDIDIGTTNRPRSRPLIPESLAADNGNRFLLNCQ